MKMKLLTVRNTNTKQHNLPTHFPSFFLFSLLLLARFATAPQASIWASLSLGKFLKVSVTSSQARPWPSCRRKQNKTTADLSQFTPHGAPPPLHGRPPFSVGNTIPIFGGIREKQDRWPATLPPFRFVMLQNKNKTKQESFIQTLFLASWRGSFMHRSLSWMAVLHGGSKGPWPPWHWSDFIWEQQQIYFFLEQNMPPCKRTDKMA